MDDFLAVEGLLVCRQHEGISDHIVDETGTHRSREANEAHLNGSRPPRGNPSAGSFRIALQFNENIDSISLYAIGSLGVCHRPEIDEFIEGAAKPRAEFAAVLRSMRIGDDFEARLVVAFEEFSYEKPILSFLAPT
jgi:hypothetical protein